MSANVGTRLNFARLSLDHRPPALDRRTAQNVDLQPDIPRFLCIQPVLPTSKAVETVKTFNVVKNLSTIHRCHGRQGAFRQVGHCAWYLSFPTVNFTKDPDYNPLPPNGFRDWDWVGKDSYAGTVALEGGKCFVFVPSGAGKADLSNPSGIKEQLAAQPLVAHVDPETRLPLALRMGGVTRRYQFVAPPDTVQALPPDLAEQIKKTEGARARLLQPAPRPY